MDAQAKIAKLEKKILEMSARSKFQEMGGDVSHWDNGLKNGILSNLSLNTDGELDQAAFDSAIKQFPGIQRHMVQPEQPEEISLTLPDSLGSKAAWEVLTQTRSASSPRR